MRIRTKSTILFLSLSLIPLMGVGKFAYENGRQAIKKNLGLAFQQLAHTQIENVENNIGEVYKSVGRWSKMSIMQEVVIGDMDATIQSFLLDVKKENKNFTYISVMNSEGAVIASTLPEMLGKSFKAARADNPRVEDVHYSDIRGEWEMTFVFPIKAQFAQDQIIGSLMAGWSAAALSRMVHLSTEGGTEQQVKGNHFMLMRNDGLVIAAPEFEQHSIFKVNLIERGLRSALLASQKHEGYLIEENEHGVESLIGYDYAKGHTDFPDLGWFGFVFSNTDMALAAVERLKVVTFAGGSIVALIVIILSLLASRKLTTPLLTIAEAVGKVARGDFQTRVAINSKDEFGQVARAFNAMAEDLQGTTVSKEYVDSIIANMKNSLIILTPRMEIQMVNEATRALLGYKDEELLGRPFDMLLAGDGTSIRSRLEGPGDKKVARNEEIQYKTKDGREIPVLFSAASMGGKNNEINGLVCVAQDITERKTRENELREAYKEVADKEKALRQTFNHLNNAHDRLKTTQNQLVQSEKLASIGQLAAGVAHEINNPVGFISSNMEILEQYIADYAKVLKMADHLKESVEQENLAKAKSISEEIARLKKEINLDYIISDTTNLLEHSRKGIGRIQKIVMDLLTFAREDKNVMEHVKIEDVIEGVLNIVHSEIKYKAKLEKNYGDTPLIGCNPQRLGQVFLNLIVNALHALPDRQAGIEGTGTIEIKTYKQDEFVCVDVRDTGKGIPPEILNKIFDPFFTTKPAGQGTGLGLSVSYEIIKKHNGRMTVRSKVGEGTTFTILLPINQGKGEKS